MAIGVAAAFVVHPPWVAALLISVAFASGVLLGSWALGIYLSLACVCALFFAIRNGLSADSSTGNQGADGLSGVIWLTIALSVPLVAGIGLGAVANRLSPSNAPGDSSGVDGPEGLIWRWRYVLVGAGVLAVVTLGYNGLHAAVVCKEDTSYCALTQEKAGYYTGVLAKEKGPPLTDRTFPVYLESRRDNAVSIRTDASGHYCLVWAHEDIVPEAELSPSFAELLRGEWRPLNGHSPPPGCQTTSQTVPWDRADDWSSSWQWTLLWGLPTLSLALLASAWRSRRRHVSGALAAVGLATTAASILLSATLW